MASSKIGKIVIDALMATVVGTTTAAIKQELEKAKEETKAKLKGLAIGAGLFFAAGAFLFFAVLVLLAAAVAGLSEAWPVWLSALTIGGSILLIALILIGIGAAKVKKNKDLKPTETIENLKQSFNFMN